MSKITVVLYYADWCGHCKDFKPVWEELKDAFKTINVKYEEYEADNNPKEIEKAHVQGFPTIIIKHNGEEEEYQKGRDFETLFKYIEDKKEQMGGATDYFEKYKKYKLKYLKLRRNKHH